MIDPIELSMALCSALGVDTSRGDIEAVTLHITGREPPRITVRKVIITSDQVTPLRTLIEQYELTPKSHIRKPTSKVTE